MATTRTSRRRRRATPPPVQWTCREHQTPATTPRCQLCEDQTELFPIDDAYPRAIREWRRLHGVSTAT